MRGIGDRFHFRVAKMRFEAAALLRQYTAGRSDLDDIAAGTRGLANLFRTLDRPGAAVTAGQQIIDVLGKASCVAMATDDSKRRTCGDDAWPRNEALRCSTP